MENKSLSLGQIADYNFVVARPEDLYQFLIEYFKNSKPCTVYYSNAHMVSEGEDSKDYKEILKSCDFLCPDGMPLVLTLKLLGYKKAHRLYGPGSMEDLLRICCENSIPVGLYGGSAETLQILIQKIKIKWPKLSLLYALSPPIGTAEELIKNCPIPEDFLKTPHFLFVGLGCPKQEIWSHLMKAQMKGPILAVGAAFDFIAGTKRKAPSWMQRLALEWLFRLMTEPRRLWKRYFITNTKFILFLIGKVFLRPHPSKTRGTNI